MKQRNIFAMLLVTTRTCTKYSKAFDIFETGHAAVVARLIAEVLAHEQSILQRLLFLEIDILPLLRGPRDSAIVRMLALHTILT